MNGPFWAAWCGDNVGLCGVAEWSREERKVKDEEIKEERVEKQAEYNFSGFHGCGSLNDGGI